jgi:hypothetical protein
MVLKWCKNGVRNFLVMGYKEDWQVTGAAEYAQVCVRAIIGISASASVSESVSASASASVIDINGLQGALASHGRRGVCVSVYECLCVCVCGCIWATRRIGKSRAQMSMSRYCATPILKYVCECVCMCVYVCVFTYVCLHLCVCVYMFMCREVCCLA